MYNFGEQQVISVGGDHVEPKLLRRAHSFKVVALGIKSFMRVSGVKPKPVHVSEMARNPYSIRDRSKRVTVFGHFSDLIFCLDMC